MYTTDSAGAFGKGLSRLADKTPTGQLHGSIPTKVWELVSVLAAQVLVVAVADQTLQSVWVLQSVMALAQAL